MQVMCTGYVYRIYVQDMCTGYMYVLDNRVVWPNFSLFVIIFFKVSGLGTELKHSDCEGV